MDVPCHVVNSYYFYWVGVTEASTMSVSSVCNSASVAGSGVVGFVAVILAWLFLPIFLIVTTELVLAQ